MSEVRVTVQTEDRLRAINNLSIAIRRVAEALASGTLVEIKDSVFHGGNPAVNINTVEEVTKTMIEKTE